jgi:hypothetical protein
MRRNKRNPTPLARKPLPVKNLPAVLAGLRKEKAEIEDDLSKALKIGLGSAMNHLQRQALIKVRARLAEIDNEIYRLTPRE